MSRSTFEEEGLGLLNSPHSRAAGTRNYVQQAFSTYGNVQPPIISDAFLPASLPTTHRAGYLARDISFGGPPVDSIPDPTPKLIHATSLLRLF